jgi:CRP-like cAMP-binding protein
MDGPVRQRSLWRHNLGVVLREVGAGVPTSRAGISETTGLTRATVSALVDDLLRAGLVAEVDPAPRWAWPSPGS